jgi:hypothetical protein
VAIAVGYDQRQPGAVVISLNTRRLTGGLFDYRDLGAVVVKGFAQPVPAWQVLRASAAVAQACEIQKVTSFAVFALFVPKAGKADPMPATPRALRSATSQFRV